MKRKTVGIVLCMLPMIVLPAITEVSVNTEQNIKSLESDLTHVIFAEYGTTTWCSPCKNAHSALKNIYAGGWYPFYYVSLIADKNTHAYSRLYDDYEIGAFPTVFFDGGYRKNVGAGSPSSTQAAYNVSIIACGNREVSDIDIFLNVTWLGDATIDIAISVPNNKMSTYNGTLRVYVTEIVSTMGWHDHGDNPYTFAFLDYAFNEPLSINAESAWEDAITWNGREHSDGYGHDFGHITYGNIMVIASVFDSKGYVDETTGVIPLVESDPPDTPSIKGKIFGKVGKEYAYTFVTTDPDEDDVFYYIEWGDGQIEEWIGPFSSGEEVAVNHTWNKGGIYIVQAKAKDIYKAESQWATLKVIMPQNHGLPISFFDVIEQYFPHLFSILNAITGGKI